MIRLDPKSMDIFVNGITCVNEADVDALLEGTEQLLAAVKFAKKNGKQVYADHRETKRDGKDPWPFIRYRVSDRDWREKAAPTAVQEAGSWK